MRKLLKFVIGLSICIIFGSIFLPKLAHYLKHEASQALVSPTKRHFIEKMAPIAQQAQRQDHVLASITIAQAALESDWGQSQLALKYNNLFGVKGTGLNSALMTTKEYVNGQWQVVQANFVVYPSWQAAIDGHSRLLAEGRFGNPSLYQTNYVTAAQALQQNRYATDPNYAKKLITLIKEYQLNRYD